MAGLCRECQRSVAISIEQIDRRPVLEQAGGHARSAGAGGHVQRGAVALVLRVDRRSRSQQQLDDLGGSRLGAAAVRRVVQRSLPRGVGGTDAGAELHQLRHESRVPGAARQVQRRRARPVRRIDVAAAIERRA